MLLASKGESLEMLLNIPQCTEKVLTGKNDPDKDTNHAEAEEP